MDNNTSKQPDILENLFKKIQEEELPASFHQHVMEEIGREAAKTQKQKEWFGLVATIAVSLLMPAIVAITFFYLDLPTIQWPKVNTQAFSFYCYIGGLTLFLLFIDYKLRKRVHKNK